MPQGPSFTSGPASPRVKPAVVDSAGDVAVAGTGMDGGPASETGVDAGRAGRGLDAKASRGSLSFLRELPFLVGVAFLLALLIKTFVLQAFFIPSQSMDPTVEVGDRVLVNKVVYRLHPPRRGDVIVFEDPHPVETEERGPVSAVWHWLTEGLGVASSPERDFIKRVVGLPGETVEIDRQGVVRIDGKALDEPYLAGPPDARPYGPVTVPGDSVFVMGDNRLNSGDSRFGLGFIPFDRVIGQAFVLAWPPSRIGWLH